MTRLEELVRVLDSRHGWTDGTEWIQVLGTVDDYELVADTRLDRLLGFVAPPRCEAIGMTALGLARSTEPSADCASAPRQRVRITCLVARTGEVAGRISWADGTQVEEPPQSGRSLDILRRCLGLATEPPSVPSTHLVAAQWLDGVSRMAERWTQPLSWDEVAFQHPAMQLARAAGSPSAPTTSPKWPGRRSGHGRGPGCCIKPADPDRSPTPCHPAPVAGWTRGCWPAGCSLPTRPLPPSWPEWRHS
jgi:hypothetical protein